MDGVVNIYKEKGISSFAVVKKVRWLFNTKKCGHTGTLDPLAEGVLPVCLGHATKLADYMMALDKEYVAQFRLGEARDSYDTDGEITAENRDIKPSKEEVEAVLKGFVGEVELTVPAYSAVKINGVRAYDLARKGEIEDAGSRVMSITDIELMDYSYPDGLFRMKCRKGTYVRSVIHEAGLKLGCYGVMSGLIRTVNGKFTQGTAFKLGDLETMKDEGRLAEAVIPVDKALGWAKAVIREEAVKLVKNGLSVKRHNYQTVPDTEDRYVFLTAPDGELLAFAEHGKAEDQPFVIVKLLV
jgi:tRNA pseudouridine55 synthase